MSFLKKIFARSRSKTNVTEPVSAANSPKPSEDGEDNRMEDTDNLSDSEPVTPASTTVYINFRIRADQSENSSVPSRLECVLVLIRTYLSYLICII